MARKLRTAKAHRKSVSQTQVPSFQQQKSAKQRPSQTSSKQSGNKNTLLLAMVLTLGLGIVFSVAFSNQGSVVSKSPVGSSATSGNFVEDRFAGRIEQLQNRVVAKPDDVQAWIELGNLYFDSQRSQEAATAYERALAIRPDNANVLTDLGVMYRRLGQYEKALEQFAKAQRINPRHQTSFFNTGIVLYYDLGRTAEARVAWERVVEINPNATTPNGKLVKTLLQELQ